MSRGSRIALCRVVTNCAGATGSESGALAYFSGFWAQCCVSDISQPWIHQPDRPDTEKPEVELGSFILYCYPPTTVKQLESRV